MARRKKKRSRRAMGERGPKKLDDIDWNAVRKPTGRMLTVTFPNGRKERIPDDGRALPKGTMVSWDAPDHRGRPTMRWSVIGGGWPFDD